MHGARRGLALEGLRAGVRLEIDFVAPEDAPAAHRGVTVTVVYALFDGLPVYEKHVRVANNGVANYGGGGAAGSQEVQKLNCRAEGRGAPW